MDTRTLLSENNLDVLADQFFERQNAYACIPYQDFAQNVPAGTNVLIDWTNAPQRVLSGVVQQDSNTGFRVSSKGVYLVDCKIPIDAPLVNGAQCYAVMRLNGGLVAANQFSSNIIYANTGSGGNCLLFIKAFILVSNSPANFDFVVYNSANTSNSPASFRNCSMSIFKIGPLL